VSLIQFQTNGGEGLAPLLNASIRFINWLCVTACKIALLAIIAIVTLEIFMRSVLATSTYMADEVSGYMLVLVAFMSLGTCQINGGFHRVELLTDNVPRPVAKLLLILFDLIAVVLAVLFLWKFWAFFSANFRTGNVAPTLLATPMWLPQLSMVVGIALYLAAAILTLLVHVSEFGRGTSGKAETR